MQVGSTRSQIPHVTRTIQFQSKISIYLLTFDIYGMLYLSVISYIINGKYQFNEETDSTLPNIEKVRDCGVGYLEQTLLDNQVYMRCPAYKAVQIFCLDVEIYIDSMDRFTS
jgi:hypothetical protein